MKVGDLVETPTQDNKLAVIVKLDEPSIEHPYQIATVRYLKDLNVAMLVTTVLRVVSENESR